MFCQSGGLVKKLSLILLPFLIALFVPFSSPVFGNDQTIIPMEQEQRAPVIAELLSEEDAINPGRAFWVGVRLKMAKGWDTYWVNPGDSGFPTQVNWNLPEGFKVGPLHWPYPEKFSQETLTAYGYTDSVVLLAEIIPPKNLKIGEEIKISAEVSWLACNESCVPGNADVTLTLPVKAHPPEFNEIVALYFNDARDLLPKPLHKEEGIVKAKAAQDKIVIEFDSAPGKLFEIVEAFFFPEEGLIDHQAPQTLKKRGEGFTLDLELAEAVIPPSLKGVLLVTEKGSDIKRAIIIDTTLDHPSGTAGKINAGLASFWVALGLAFVGGLILNVMPCVLPVIALKIFSFVKMAGEKRSLIFKQGAVFSLGVILSFWILAGLLLLLRAYGEGVGWGFQLQEPIFVVILASVLFLLGLSLFGVFEMGTSLISLGQPSKSKSSPLLSSFWSGVLATLVATPCTGPLLGPALGFAMTLPTFLNLAIFTSMGIGMAFPYLLFSAFPKLVRFLPKPGNWLIVFKQLMGFLMMGTVVWLVWVFGAQTDNMAIFALLVSFVVLALGAWIFGSFAGPMKKRATRRVATVLAITVMAFGVGFGVYTAKIHKALYTPTTSSQVNEKVGWEAYDPDRVQELREQGTPVFIDFTAKWCLICQTNKMALHSKESERAFAAAGIVRMEADWTRRDPVITKQLQELGRSGVPVYVLYPGDPNADPIILPQTLTSSVVVNAIIQVTDKSFANTH